MFSFFILSTLFLFFFLFFGAFVLSPSFSTHWRLICDSRRICQAQRRVAFLAAAATAELPMKLENFFSHLKLLRRNGIDIRQVHVVKYQ